MSVKRDEQLFFELETYYQYGITLWIENQKVSPIELMNCGLVEEESDYMRDYITNEQGVVKEIRFHKIGR